MPVPQLIKPKRFGDERGWFSETFSQRAFDALGLSIRFIQDNHAYSKAAGVLRGLHFQAPPDAQTKLVRCTAGAIFDVAVDIRNGSPTFGRHVAATLSAANGWQLLVPAGFAHGYLTVTEDSEVQYKVDSFYAPASEGGLSWDDPALAIDWPLEGRTPVLGPRDLAWPRLANLETPFDYDGEPLSPLDLAGAA